MSPESFDRLIMEQIVAIRAQYIREYVSLVTTDGHYTAATAALLPAAGKKRNTMNTNTSKQTTITQIEQREEVSSGLVQECVHNSSTV